MEVEMTPANGRGPTADSSQPSDEDHWYRDALLSGALVSNAFVGLPFDFKTDLRSLKLYFIYHHWSLNYILYLCLFLIHFLTLFENIGQPRSHAVAVNLTTTVEVLCLTYFVIRLFLRYLVTPKYPFWHDTTTVVLLWAIGMTFLDILAYFIISADRAVRFTLCLRPLFVVSFTENRQIRRAMLNIRNTLPDIINVLILFFISLAIFSLIAFKLFNGQKLTLGAPNEYFSSYFDSMYDLYVLVTTANNPSITMNAYNQNRLYALFFVVFLIVNVYLFMNIILAVIYNKYRAYLKNGVRQILQIRADNLGKAFDILTKGDEAGMTYEQFQRLMETVFYAKSIFRWQNSQDPALIEIIWSFLETNGRIRRSDFMNLGEIMGLEIRIIRPTSLTNSWHFCCPFIYDTVLSQKFKATVKSPYFRYFFDFCICLNILMIALDIDKAELTFETVLLVIFTFEILSKIYAFGPLDFIQRWWNIFDTLVILSAISLWLLMYHKTMDRTTLERYFDIVLVLRVLRICKIIGNFERFYVPVVTIRSLIPSMITYGGLLLVVFYFYAIIGVHLFRGLVYEDPKGCNPSSIHCCPPELLAKGIIYCSINFNKVASAFLLLFDLMVVNDWHEFVHNYELQSATKYTRLFFVSFHLTCVIIVLNIFAAFVIEAFILEFTNTTQRSAHVNILLSKIKQLGINCINRDSMGKKERQDSLVNSNDISHDEFEAYRRHDRSLSVITVGPEIPKYQVQVIEKDTVEAFLIRMFQREIENESRGIH